MTLRRRTVFHGLAATAGLASLNPQGAWGQAVASAADLVLHNGRVTTMDPARPLIPG